MGARAVRILPLWGGRAKGYAGKWALPVMATVLPRLGPCPRQKYAGTEWHVAAAVCTRRVRFAPASAPSRFPLP